MNYKSIDEYIGKKIMDKRIEKRYTVVEMSELLNVSRQGYYDYENGKTTIPSDRCVKLCKHLGIDYLQLMQDALTYAQEIIKKEAYENFFNKNDAEEQ